MSDFDKEAIAAEIKRQSEESTDDSDLLNKTAERMEALGFDPKADEIIPEDEPVPEEDLEDVEDDDEEGDDLESEDEEDDDSTPEDDDEEEVDTDGEEVATDEEADGDTEQKGEPQLSDAYYRAAIHSGMNEQEIVDFMEVNPKLALKTFGSLYESMNRASQEFADIGRFKKNNPADSADDVPVEKPGFAKIDTTDMRNEYGDVVADQFDKQQEQLAELYKNQSAPQPIVVDSSAQALAKEQEANAAKQIDSFFGDKEMVKYKDTYGVTAKNDVDWKSLMPSAMMNRVAVIERAQELVEGASAMGREMTVDDALERAHLLVTQPIRDKIIRDELVSKVVKRSKGITLKPSNKVAGVTEKTKGPKTESEIIDNASARLAKTFG